MIHLQGCFSDQKPKKRGGGIFVNGSEVYVDDIGKWKVPWATKNGVILSFQVLIGWLAARR